MWAYGEGLSERIPFMMVEYEKSYGREGNLYFK